MIISDSTLRWQAQRINELEARVAELEEELKELRVLDLPRLDMLVARAMRLTPQQARFTAALLRARRPLTRKALIEQIETEASYPPGLVGVLICKINTRCRAIGVESRAIEYTGYEGYVLSQPARRAMVTNCVARMIADLEWTRARWAAAR